MPTKKKLQKNASISENVSGFPVSMTSGLDFFWLPLSHVLDQSLSGHCLEEFWSGFLLTTQLGSKLLGTCRSQQSAARARVDILFRYCWGMFSIWESSALWNLLKLESLLQKSVVVFCKKQKTVEQYKSIAKVGYLYYSNPCDLTQAEDFWPIFASTCQPHDPPRVFSKSHTRRVRPAPCSFSNCASSASCTKFSGFNRVINSNLYKLARVIFCIE